MPTGQGGREDVLTIGAYSVVREVLHEALLPAFAARWKAETGRDVRFEESYNGSGAQSRAIAAGFDADIAILSLEDDVTPLVKAKLVSEGWNKGPDKGMVTRSLVVVAVRPGNPLGDPGLARPGRAPASASSTPTRRPPAVPGGTSTPSTAPGCSATEGRRSRMSRPRNGS